jgi:hypothetical protein
MVGRSQMSTPTSPDAPDSTPGKQPRDSVKVIGAKARSTVKRVKAGTWDATTRLSRALAFAIIAALVVIVLSVLWPVPLTAIGTLLAAIAALVFGIGGHEIRALFFKPALKVTIDLHAPDAILIQTLVTLPQAGGYVPTFYYRMRVSNDGNATAREVEVRLLRLRKHDPASGQFVLDPNFLPLNITWSYVGGVVLPSIHASLFHNCDLLHIVEDNPLSQAAYPDPTQFMFNTRDRPNPVGQGVWPTLKPVGLYELDLVAYGANADPTYRTFTIDYRGWYPTESDMFTKGLIVTPKA